MAVEPEQLRVLCAELGEAGDERRRIVLATGVSPDGRAKQPLAQRSIPQVGERWLLRRVLQRQQPPAREPLRGRS